MMRIKQEVENDKLYIYKLMMRSSN